MSVIFGHYYVKVPERPAASALVEYFVSPKGLSVSVFSKCASIYASSFDADVVFASSTPLTIAIPGVFAALKQRALCLGGAGFVVQCAYRHGDVEIFRGAMALATP